VDIVQAQGQFMNVKVRWGLMALSMFGLASMRGVFAVEPIIPALNTDYAFTANVLVGTPLVVDHTPDGVRRYIPIIGGTVTGPKINGKVLAAGGDSQIIRSDGVIVLEARYMIQTDDNVTISVTNRGYRHASPAVMARLLRGEHVGREEYYFRTVARFEAPVGSRYEDLNKYLFIGTAEREANAAIVHFYRVK
jgi:Protein of unknown function (DUF3237)